MIFTTRLGLAAGLMTALVAANCRAETWSDLSGQFTVEAEYVRVEGRSVVLRKSDGRELTVPIAKLSAASRAQAKKLYEAAKSNANPAPKTPPAGVAAPGEAAAPAANAGGAANMPAAAIEFGVTMPEPAAVKPMEPFPADASLQQTVDHIRDQIIAGHPEVIWYALPTSMRTELDSDELRQTMQPMIQKQMQVTKPVEVLMKKVVQILVKQKNFVLNSEMLKSQVPPPMMPMVQQAYDPAVGILSELVAIQFAVQKTGSQTFTDMVDYHGPRIGGHMQGLMPMLPPGMLDQAMGQIQVTQTDATSGTMTIPSEEGEEVTPMVRYEDRWIPAELATEWDQMKGSLIETVQGAMALAEEQTPQATMMIGMITTTAGGMLDPMLNATSQQEFDAAIMQLMGLAAMFGGGGDGGGFPGGPGGAPDGGFPGGF
ncbi:MAG: SHD1 domain-containing protein [Rubripirellula sp.]